MYSKTKGTSKVKGNGRSVCWPKNNTYLETLPNSRCMMRGMMKICPQLVGVSIQVYKACKIACFPKPGVTHHNTLRPSIVLLDQSV